jgi:A/G-specific adenine glycosylase
MTKTIDFSPLRRWFLQVARPFPWRVDRTPYAVLVSEIMLQQTQASRVVDYFLRWMRQFPTIQSLAFASETEVLKMWEGLGYYSRARALHKAAKVIGEKIPEEEEALRKIPGIGPYTAGALRAFAFKKKAVALDANVSRVLSRLFEFQGEVTKEHSRRLLHNQLFDLLPEEEPHVVMEGLIELGAVVCKKKPDCVICPLSPQCNAWKNNTQEDYPKKQAPPKTTQLYRHVLLIELNNTFLVRKTPVGEVMEGLYQFPFIELMPFEALDLEKSLEPVKALLQISAIDQVAVLPKIRHGFTRYQATLYPVYYRVQQRTHLELSGYEWRTKEEIACLAFSSGHRQIWNSYMARN